VPENPRIEELRRRVLKDKASIAFAQLAEEYRRAGRFEEAIETCRTGLSHHPGYLSAHVTLGRALIEIGELEQAQTELMRVLSAAPENLAALKGLAEIHHRRGELPEALANYRQALVFAPHDPDLEHLVGQITRELEPPTAAPVPDGLSFEEAMGEFLALGDAPVTIPSQPEPVITEAPAIAEEPAGLVAEPPVVLSAEAPPAIADLPVVLAAEPLPVAAGAPSVALADVPLEELHADAVAPLAMAEEPAQAATDSSHTPAQAARNDEAAPKPKAVMQVEALERWLDAILAERRQRD
jgi:hypothetical protein